MAVTCTSSLSDGSPQASIAREQENIHILHGLRPTTFVGDRNVKSRKGSVYLGRLRVLGIRLWGGERGRMGHCSGAKGYEA